MLHLDKDIETLRGFGLTTNQARVYLAICHLGIAPVGKVSKLAHVRREDVYRILPKLEEMGLTERTLDTPAKIRATPLQDALSTLIKHEKEMHDQKINALVAKKEELVRNFRANSRKTELEDEDSQFTLISEKAAILKKASAMLKDVRSEVAITGSRQKLIQIVSVYADLLKKAVKRGVKIRMVTELPEEEDPLPRFIEEQLSPSASVKLKYAEALPSHFAVFDNTGMMVATTTHEGFAERPALWTNSPQLIAPMQKAFEDLWHSSMNWSNFKSESESERLARFLGELKPSDHVIFMYDTPEAKYHVLFNYIKQGLENGEAALYVCSEANPRQIRNAMKRFGIDVDKCEESGALRILYYTEFYIIDGKFSIPNTLCLWNKFYKEAISKGFSGLRVTGETACFFKHKMVQNLLEYEKALHTVLDIPMIAVCSYCADILNDTDDPINLYHELAKAHGTVLYTGINSKLGRIELRRP